MVNVYNFLDALEHTKIVQNLNTELAYSREKCNKLEEKSIKNENGKC